MDATNAALRIVLGVQETEEFSRMRKLYNWYPPDTKIGEREFSKFERLVQKHQSMWSRSMQKGVTHFYVRSYSIDYHFLLNFLRDINSLSLTLLHTNIQENIDYNYDISTISSRKKTLHELSRTVPELIDLLDDEKIPFLLNHDISVAHHNVSEDFAFYCHLDDNNDMSNKKSANSLGNNHILIRLEPECIARI